MTPDAIFQVAYGFTAAKTLLACSELGMFEALAEGTLTSDELAERMGVPERSASLLANAMVALGFVELAGDRYGNSEVSRKFLSGTTPADLRPMLRFMNRITYPQWGDLENAARTGEGSTVDYPTDVYSTGMEAINAGTAAALTAVYDFTPHQRVLDVGGGTGSFLTAIIRRHPHVQGTLFERAEVMALARTGVDLVAGDFLVDPLPPGHDAVIVANVMHHLSAGNVVKLLERIRTANPAATLLLIDFWTDPTHTQPMIAALTGAQFLLSSESGRLHSAEEMTGWLTEAGWTFDRHLPLNGATSLIVAQAA
ncbi:SAM-dependent methyltransferase [Lentzea sp. NBRC 105346]|uniref:methyltransferase n=1 Tax=Lentzea sp. NBRC 105346 TaxID=3032205 RepID=UPI0024A07A84|nr:methyltransferase [Lentzea sp. NBRC 105346]GLZ29935.1 SAM-dependent methyltransferase [Lentzea sp. NBRC 105346]